MLAAQREVVFPFALIRLAAEVEQGVVGGIGHRDGRLQLVGDVVGEVGLHFIQRALLEDGADQVIKSQSQQQHNDCRCRQDTRHLTPDQIARRLNGEHITSIVRPVVFILSGLA